MNIQLKQLHLTNFKGIRDLVIEFDHQTDISGDNGTGKTTIADAFRWLLFGKDSTGRSNFEIKTTTPEGEAIHRLEHEVSAVLLVDGEVVCLRRLYKEKWVKKRGAATDEFQGHETTFYCNDVPMSLSEYNARIDSIIPENLFKLTTDPQYFNSLHWQDRRNILISMAGHISNSEVAGRNTAFQDLIAQMGKKTIEEFKKEIGAKKKIIKDELQQLPPRIDELRRSCPEVQDWKGLDKQLQTQEQALASLEAQIMDQSKEMSAWQMEKLGIGKDISDLQDKMLDIESRHKSEIRQQEQERTGKVDLDRQKLDNQKNHHSTLQREAARISSKIEALQAKRKVMLARFDEVKAQQIQIDESKFNCPTCRRPLEAYDIEAAREEMTRNFNQTRADTLVEINREGKQVSAEISENEQQLQGTNELIAGVQAKITELELSISEFQSSEANANRPTLESLLAIRLDTDLEYIGLSGELAKKKDEKDSLTEFTPDPELSSKKHSVQQSIYAIRQQLSSREQIEKINVRIAELEAQEQAQAQELATLEGIEFTMLEFMKAKMDLVETRINGMFDVVTFRMFKRNINGGEEEACDTLINGVPWLDANNAARINGGLDIIQALNKYHGMSAPVVVDNAEAINKLLLVKTQIIRLVVSQEKKLSVSTEAAMKVAV